MNQGANTRVITFTRPFMVDGLKVVFPAGDYFVEVSQGGWTIGPRTQATASPSEYTSASGSTVPAWRERYRCPRMPSNDCSPPIARQRPALSLLWTICSAKQSRTREHRTQPAYRDWRQTGAALTLWEPLF